MKKNCIIIANDIGFSAPGIVFETIILELSKLFALKVICPKIRDCSIFPEIEFLPCSPIARKRYRMTVLNFMLFGRDFQDAIWANQQMKKVQSDALVGADVVISLVSNEHYNSLILGNKLSLKYNKKWFIYSVDAIPAPIRWTNNRCYYNRTVTFFNKYLKQCDAFFSSNSQMLDYQLNNISGFNGYKGVIYTPIRSNSMASNSNITQGPTILYTGNIYGPRKISAVLDGFRLLLNDYPKAKLIFVGAKRINGKIKNHLDLVNNGNVVFHNYTSDLTIYYKTATVLLDINAYFDNDVFLSSKIINYLPFNKPIVSITGLGSPGRSIFTDDSSIIHSTHDPKDIYAAFHKAISLKEVIKEERAKYIKMFEVQNCIKDLVSTISNF